MSFSGFWKVMVRGTHVVRSPQSFSLSVSIPLSSHSLTTCLTWKKSPPSHAWKKFPAKSKWSQTILTSSMSWWLALNLHVQVVELG